MVFYFYFRGGDLDLESLLYLLGGDLECLRWCLRGGDLDLLLSRECLLGERDLLWFSGERLLGEYRLERDLSLWRLPSGDRFLGERSLFFLSLERFRRGDLPLARSEDFSLGLF